MGQDNENGRAALLHYESGTWTSVEPTVEISSDWGLSALDSLSSTGGWMAGEDFANKRGVLLHYETVLVTPPVVSTTAVSEITATAATSGGNITSDGGASVTARGVCWGTSINPVVGGTCTSDGTGTGTFISSIGGLTASTRYHVRAYATNVVGTSYGSDVTFTTLSTSVLPVVTTAPGDDCGQHNSDDRWQRHFRGGYTGDRQGRLLGCITIAYRIASHLYPKWDRNGHIYQYHYRADTQCHLSREGIRHQFFGYPLWQ